MKCLEFLNIYLGLILFISNLVQEMFANFHLLQLNTFIHSTITNFHFLHLIHFLYEENCSISFSSIFDERLSPISSQLFLQNNNEASLCLLEIKASFFRIHKYLLWLQLQPSFSFLNIQQIQTFAYSIQCLPCLHSLSMLIMDSFQIIFY